MPRPRKSSTAICAQNLTVAVRKDKLEEFNHLLAAFLKKVNIMNKRQSEAPPEVPRVMNSARVAQVKRTLAAEALQLRTQKLAAERDKLARARSDDEEWHVVTRRRRRLYDMKSDKIFQQMSKRVSSEQDLGRKIPDIPDLAQQMPGLARSTFASKPTFGPSQPPLPSAVPKIKPGVPMIRFGNMSRPAREGELPLTEKHYDSLGDFVKAKDALLRSTGAYARVGTPKQQHQPLIPPSTVPPTPVQQKQALRNERLQRDAEIEFNDWLEQQKARCNRKDPDYYGRKADY